MFSQLTSTPEFWVAVSFFGFVALLMWFKVPGLMAKALDARADQIRGELDEARRLRVEAQALLEEYKKKQVEAQKEAESIVAGARREAESLAAESRKNLAESVERRAKFAVEKIARAEAQAVSEVRAAAVDAAVAAAQSLIGAKLSPATAGGLIEKSIGDLKAKLN